MKQLRVPIINRIQITGTIVSKPDIIMHPEGDAKLWFDLSCSLDESYAESQHLLSSYIPVVAWNSIAKENYYGIENGSYVYVEGALRALCQKTDDGLVIPLFEIHATLIEILRDPPESPKKEGDVPF
jgi:primosomal replication protein N